jgi:DNA gyrase subunit B
MKKNYDANSLEVLKGLDAIRKRPTMYIGSLDSDGKLHCAKEVIDNCIDEAMAGFCDTINIAILKDGTVEIHDNGRVIPHEMNTKENKTGIEIAATEIHGGGKFNNGKESNYQTSGGLNGVGLSAVNALSSEMYIEVIKDGQSFNMSFKKGIKQYELKKGDFYEKGLSGTSIIYKLDNTIFNDDAILEIDKLKDLVMQRAFLNKGLKILLEVESTKESITYFYENGLQDYIQYLLTKSNSNPMFPPITTGLCLDRDTGIKVELTLTFTESLTDIEPVEIAFCNTLFNESGTHLTGFRTGLTNTFKKF